MKYHFSKRCGRALSTDADERTIISSALVETYVKYLKHAGMRRPMSPEQAVRDFSKKWHRYKSVLYKQGKFKENRTSDLMEAHDRLMKIHTFIPSTAEVALADFETERRIGEYVVRDRIDAILLDKTKGGSGLNILQMDPTATRKGELDYANHLRALFNLGYVRRSLSSGSGKIQSTLVNTYYKYEREIKVNDYSRINYPRAIARVIDAMEGGAIYPRAGVEACHHCVFRDECPWKIIN